MRLYHFMKEEYARKALNHRRLKISEIDKLNDPFELLGVNFRSIEFEKAFLKMKGEQSKNIGILCFSESYKNPVQWSHYAEYHKGICLVFELNASMLARGQLKKVNYKSGKLKLPYDFLRDRDKDVHFMLKVFSTKFKHWCYEKEYRAFVKLDERDGDHYFFDFCADMRLLEVILGCNSRLAYEELYKDMGDLEKSVDVSRAYTCPNEFKILKQVIK